VQELLKIIGNSEGSILESVAGTVITPALK